MRYEYSPNGRFEDRPTLLAHHRDARSSEYTTAVVGDAVHIETAKLTARFSPGKPDGGLTVVLKHSGESVAPSWLPSAYVPDITGTAYVHALNRWADSVPKLPEGNLGGWLRCLDSIEREVRTQPGLLSRRGWFFIDDTWSVVVPAGSSSYVQRPKRNGYRDWYVFAYGLDYQQALRDYRTLSGASPLLPRQAFGNWYCRYAPYTESFYRDTLLPTFRRAGIALDVLVVDTDFKLPNSWNGWNWNKSMFPDPRRFIMWAHGQKLAVGLNIHPTISAVDSKFGSVQRMAGGALQQVLAPIARYFAAREIRIGAIGPMFAWDFGNRRHLQSYMNLHDSFEDDGIDFWWLDWIMDESFVGAPRNAIADDVWISRAYTRRPHAQKNRWLLLSRNGASFWDLVGTRPGPWGGHRYAIHFTGDTVSTWPMLAFEVAFTQTEGNIGMGYVSHDIGGFKGETDPERYVRWMQFGAFSPIMRIHSADPQTKRLPWEFAEPYRSLAAQTMKVRTRLVPYLYSAARTMHDTGLPMVRSMYLMWPEQDSAYQFPHQYMLGEDMLVAPVVRPLSAGASKRIWFPPGRWADFYDGRVIEGPAVKDIPVTLDRIPAYVRAGATVPLAESGAAAEDAAAPLSLRVFAQDSGSSVFYHDDGSSTDYSSNHSWTTVTWRRDSRELAITTAGVGGYVEPEIARIELAGNQSGSITVTVNGRRVNAGRIPIAEVRADHTGGSSSTHRLL